MYHYWGHVTSETVNSAGPLTCGDYRCDEGVRLFANWPHTHAGVVKLISLSKLSVHRCFQFYITAYYESVMTSMKMEVILIVP